MNKYDKELPPMSPSQRALSSRQSIDSCTFQLHSWRPFLPKSTLDSDPPQLPNPSSNGGFHPKRPCLSDRVTSFSTDTAIDMSRLSLFDDDRTMVDSGSAAANSMRRESLRLIARKRRRRGSRSVSGRSSDRSGTRRCCSVGASAGAAASDFPMAVGTDSSGELFGNGDWASDVSEVRNNGTLRREKDGGGGGSGEKENLGLGFARSGSFGDVVPGNESGYGSEPGYRGDAEFGYGDEVDEEEEDARALFWGHHFGDTYSKREMVGENAFADQKAHHRGRRKKHDIRMVEASR